MNMRRWVKLPSAWIEDGGLQAFRWSMKEPGRGASEAAALMVLLAIAHRADLETGIARITYGELTTATGISRTKVSDGLDILQGRSLIKRNVSGRSTVALTNYGPGDRWAQLPAKPLYNSTGAIMAFEDFHLRKRAELDALKIYLAIATRRDTRQNITWMTYEKFRTFTGVSFGYIKPALGVLNINHLITVDTKLRANGEQGVVNGYRLRHIESRLHAGTTGRAFLGEAPDF